MRRNLTPLFDNLSTAETKIGENQVDFHEWFSSNEAANYLRIPVGSLRNLACNGKLKVRGKVGRLNRYHIDDLKRLLAGK